MTGDALVYHKALYYPYLRFPDLHWLKTAVLYWDGILRMVPESMSERLTTHDDSFVRDLIQAERKNPPIGEVLLYDDYPPLAEASRRLIVILEDIRTHPDRRSPYQSAMQAPGELTYLIHWDKIPHGEGAKLASYLSDRGLARLDANRAYLEPTIGQMFMALVATTVASEYGHIPVVSHEAVYNHLLRSEFLLGSIPAPEGHSSAQQDPASEEGFLEERLTSLAFQTVVPDPRRIDQLSVDQIMKFRQDYAAERREFFKFISQTTDKLSAEIDPTHSDVLQDHLKTYAGQLKEHTAKLRDALSATGIEAISQVMTLDTKLALLGVATVLTGITVSPIVAAVSGLAVGLFTVSRAWRQKRGEVRKEYSPYSYLLDLQQLTQPRSQVETITQQLAELVRGR
jgi:hypothetical protein